MCIYIYIYSERERERELYACIHVYMHVCLHLYNYIYIYTCHNTHNTVLYNITCTHIIIMKHSSCDALPDPPAARNSELVINPAGGS